MGGWLSGGREHLLEECVHVVDGGELVIGILVRSAFNRLGKGM